MKLHHFFFHVCIKQRHKAWGSSQSNILLLDTQQNLCRRHGNPTQQKKKIKHENKTHEPSMKCFNVANPSIFFCFFYKWRKGWNIWLTIPEQPLLQEVGCGDTSSVLTPHVQYIYTQTPICQSCLSEHYECLSRITNMKSQRWATSVTQPRVWGVSFPVAPRNLWEMKRWIMRYEQTLNSSIYANKFSGDTP